MTNSLLPSDCGNFAGADTGRPHLSNTQLSSFLNCERRWQHSYIDRLELVSKPLALSMGSAFHKAIETGDPLTSCKQMREERQILSQDDEDKLRKDEAIVVAAADSYLAKWGAAEVPEYEYVIRLRNPDDGVYGTYDLMGSVDGVIEPWQGGELEIIEAKFVGQFTDVAVQRILLDRQVSLECYALWRAKGKPVRKVNYRMVKKPTIRQKQTESVEQFCERVTLDYKERPDFYLHEETTFRTDEDLLEIEKELWEWQTRMEAAAAKDFHPRNTSHCHDYGGCQFIPLCSLQAHAEDLYQVKAER